MRRLLPAHRWARVALAAFALVILLVAVDLVVLSNRIDRWQVALPGEQDDVDTWVIVGSDSRSHLPGGSSADRFGTAKDVPGERADLIIVLTIRDGQARGVSVPRDLLVSDGGYPKRVGMTLLDGPQHLVDALCTSLGVSADHLVGLHFEGFVQIVDVLGGVEVTIEHPIRDPLASLDLPDAGRQRLDGEQALALVRSRTAEELIDGQWQPVGDGAGQRAAWGATVMKSVVDAASAQRFNPLTMQRLAWAATGSLRTDEHTGLLDLVGLATSSPTITPLPHDPPKGTPPPGGALPLPPNAATDSALRELGLGATCRPATT